LSVANQIYLTVARDEFPAPLATGTPVIVRTK
jgi:hypothetical protein